VVRVEKVGAEAGAAVVDDPCLSAIEMSCPGVPPLIELEVTLPESVISNAL
jgi:hypothetical protein